MRFIIKSNDIKENCLAEIRKISLDPTMCVEIKKYVKNRTKDQNSIYWKWLECFSDLTGYTKEEMHDTFRAKFLPLIKRNIKGIELVELTSTTDLNTKQFSEYMGNIELVAIEMCLQLPYPEELIYTLK